MKLANTNLYETFIQVETLSHIHSIAKDVHDIEIVQILPLARCPQCEDLDSRVDRGGEANLVPEDQQELVLSQGRPDVAVKADGEARHAWYDGKVSAWNWEETKGRKAKQLKFIEND